jgi:hypothetical protein
MRDMKRDILNQVASGAISAEEGAARLEALDQPASAPAPTQTAALPAPPPVQSTVAVRKIKVVSQFGAADIVGDPSVASAVADGPHRAHQDGDTLVIEHQPFEESDTFTFGHGGARRIIVNGFDWQRRKLVVRMNPDLELITTVQAGNVKVDSVHGPITAEVQAGNCVLADFRGPVNVTVQAGNLSASGRLDHAASKVHCEMGSVAFNLVKGSSVRISARAQLGKVAIERPGGGPLLGGGGKLVTVGAGEGTLDLECTMGNVKVSVD